MFYIFYGDDEFRRSEEIARFRETIMADGMGDLNITTFDGRKLALEELLNACDTLPFLTQRRLIIVQDMLQRYERQRSSASVKKEAERLAEYMPSMPETTRLVFVESGSLGKSNALLKRAHDLPGGHIREFTKFDLRRADDMRKLKLWIAHRAKEKGADIDPRAVELLISHVSNDLRLIDQELEKLAGHAAYQRAIRADDVTALVGINLESNIFDMVDAIGLKRRGEALQRLHELLADDANELYLLTMIARQFRLILGAKDLKENQKLAPDAIGRGVGVSHRFVLNKVMNQSALYDFDQLEHLLQRTLEIDLGIKTGRVEPVLALEMLIIEACQKSLSPASQRARNRSRTR